MDKLKMQTVNKADENFKKLAAMFPNAVTETIDENGEVVRAIDKDVLMQEISCKVVDGNEERYQFTWPDKKKSVLLANAPINKTLRPVRDDETTPTGADSEGKPYCSSGSVDFDNTENLYIEGDNLEVLKILQETYLGKIKMIYIDPPYNTGNDFVYADDFSQSTEEYLENSGQYDDEGNRLVKNLDSNGRFHTDWLNMIYTRLKIAKDLLRDNGVIFISISDIEAANLKKICDDVFGTVNCIADLIWANKEGGGSSDSKLFRIKHEHVICYAKNVDLVEIKGVAISNADRYKGADEYEKDRGKYYLQKLGMGSIQYSKSLDYPIETPDGTFVMPSDNNNGKRACWRWSKEKFRKNEEQGFVEIKKDSKGIWTVYTKQYMNCDNEGNYIDRTQRPMGIIENYSSTQAAKLLENMELGRYFNYSKPIELISYLIARIDLEGEYILDFFAGSSTTAHAVMKLDAEDGGHRKFIMVQLPEVTDEKSEAYKAGYKNICEIGKERIRRAAKKIAEENSQAKFDGGFRVLKCDTSNMKNVYYNSAEYEPSLFTSLEDNIKEDRTSEDLLFQVMLDLGVLLSSKIEETTIAGKRVFNVEDNYLIACFDDNVTEEVITEIAKQKPYYFVMRDSSMVNDSVATNFEQIFAAYSPDTVRKVL